MKNLSRNAKEVLEKRYLKKDSSGVLETPEDLFLRVARTIASVELLYGKNEYEVKKYTDEFYEMMANFDFIPNSPTLMNAGCELGQLSACFVLPVEDSMEGIFDAVKYAAIIHKSGGGTGFSFSRLRAKNSPVRSTGGIASGPVSFMKVFNAATEAVKQGGTRRGANMGILRVDHPDIIEFITCKSNDKDITNFNVSVGITDIFMNALKENGEYELLDPHTNKIVEKLFAKDVFNLIVESAWKNGEPGIVFIDAMNRTNPTVEIGAIEATNPCGEQPLLPYESCNLGSINLSNFVKVSGRVTEIDFDRLECTVYMGVRFLDNVIDANNYPLPMIKDISHANRKIGLGIMGFSEMLIKLGIPYNSDEAINIAGKVMHFIQNKGRDASNKLGHEKGPFPNIDKSIYSQDKVYNKMRNATVTTIAPTGTISMIANCSSGIEPLFAICYIKKILDGAELLEINSLFEEYAKLNDFYDEQLMKRIGQQGHLSELDDVPDAAKKLFVTAHEIDPIWHVKIQAAFQKYTDNAVSKTINFSSNATQKDISDSFIMAYDTGCKGLTVYRDRSRENQVLNTGIVNENIQVKDDSSTLNSDIQKIGPRQRPKLTYGVTDKVVTGCGNIYTTINEDETGLCEVLIHLGKSGGCATSLVEAVARLISNGLRSGLDPKTIIKHMKGIRCPQPAASYMNPDVGRPVYSCADAIALSLEAYMSGEFNNFKVRLADEHEIIRNFCEEDIKYNAGICPECGSVVKHESGCVTCIMCGYSKCG